MLNLKTLFCLILFCCAGCSTVTMRNGDCEVIYSTVAQDKKDVRYEACGATAVIGESKSDTEILAETLSKVLTRIP